MGRARTFRRTVTFELELRFEDVDTGDDAADALFEALLADPKALKAFLDVDAWQIIADNVAHIADDEGRRAGMEAQAKVLAKVAKGLPPEPRAELTALLESPDFASRDDGVMLLSSLARLVSIQMRGTPEPDAFVEVALRALADDDEPDTDVN